MFVRLDELATIVANARYIDTRIGGNATAQDIREWLNRCDSEQFAEFMGCVQSMAKNVVLSIGSLQVPVTK